MSVFSTSLHRLGAALQRGECGLVYPDRSGNSLQIGPAKKRKESSARLLAVLQWRTDLAGGLREREQSRAIVSNATAGQITRSGA
jgi:hypothetical protein